MPECTACGQENPEIARFCLACGTSMAPASLAQMEERKTVTVLFCDLVGFTAASDDADPEDVRARIRPYHLRLRREIELYGGTVEKFIGDAVMAVFGAPVAHDDDPERAVRAGLRILEAIGDLNEEDAGLDLKVRVGVETGEAMVALETRVAQGEGIVTGDVVNTASRLQGVAPVNAVVVGPGAHEATKLIFDYDALGRVALKGKTQPVAIFHAKAARARFGTDLTRSIVTPIVGRQVDLGILTGAFQKAVQESSVQLVTIVGEPGVGKSRLLAELFRFVDQWPDLIRWRQGRCLPYGEGITFWALGEIVKAEAGILETDPPDRAAAKIDALMPDGHPDASWLRQRLRPLVGLDAPEAAREENFAAWRGFIEALAEDGPAVFVFEDLHWADQALLVFLEHLADYAVGVPMLIVGTARPELYDRAPTWAAGTRNIVRVNLSPLSEAEMSKLISNLLGSVVLRAEVQQAILEFAGGNPLYAEEFVRLLRDQAILTRRGASWTIDDNVEITLPSGVKGLIAARLDTLAPERKRLLQGAAVVGKVFWSGAVAEIADQDPEEVRAALHELARRELVHPARRSSMEGEAEYSFAHALVRDVCYSQIPRGRRAERHQRAAAWIERASAGRVEDYAEILAAHYTTALGLAQAAREFPAQELAANAVRYLVLAGDRAMRIDVQAAERHYARARAMIETGEPARPEILARHGEALFQRARFPDAAQAYEEAIAAFQGSGDVRSAATAMARYYSVLYKLGDPRYRRIARQALEMLEPLGPSPELVQALTEQAAASFVSDKHREGLAFAERAIALAADLGLPEPARALGFRGGARVALGDGEGVGDMRRALEAAISQGLGREVAVLHNNLAEHLIRIEGPRARLELLRQGVDFVERRGMVEWVLVLAAQTVETMVDLGQIDQAMTAADTLVRRIESTDDWMSLLVVRLAQGWVLTRRGEFAEAHRIAQWAVEQGRDSGDPQFLAAALPLAATARFGTGDAAGATAFLAELEQIPNVRLTPSYAPNLPEATRVAIAADDEGLATRLIDGFEPVYPLDEHALTTVRALLAEQRGNLAGAADLFADAAERWAQFDMPWECAQALLGEGHCRLVLGRSAEASDRLRAARDTFTALNARPALTRTDALLQQALALTS
jgi:class 3 adenylate cyclase/tetratricopeptide (TPR) repeat protein